MYSRFSKKEVVALSITSATTLCMASVLFFANASTDTPSAEDFMADLEKTFQAPPTTVTKPDTTTSGVSSSSSSSSSSSNSNSSSSSSSSSVSNNSSSPNSSSSNGSSSVTPMVPTQPKPTTTTPPVVTSGGMATQKPDPVLTVNNAPTDGLSETSSTANASAASKGNSTETAPAVVPPLNSAKQCNLPAIDILQTEELDTKTIVRWRDVPGAAGYDVMKRSKSGEFVMIERVKTPIYTAHLARGSVKYEDFKVAAVCGDTKSPSVNTSKVTSVKTGPVQTLIILIISMLASAAIVLRKKFARN